MQIVHYEICNTGREQLAGCNCHGTRNTRHIDSIRGASGAGRGGRANQQQSSRIRVGAGNALESDQLDGPSRKVC